MFRNSKVSNQLANRVARAAEEAMSDYSLKLVEQEHHLTDRFLANCQSAVNHSNIGGLRWIAKTFTDRGPGSQENSIGADFLGSFHVDMPTYSVTKGFLGQAKRVEPSDSYSASSFSELQKQCRKMLDLSAASYVFLYSKEVGVQVIPALSVISARSCNPHELTSKPVKAFFVDHFECFVGDRGIGISPNAGVEGLLQELKVRRALSLSGSSQRPEG